jgi:hypothetical protein
MAVLNEIGRVNAEVDEMVTTRLRDVAEKIESGALICKELSVDLIDNARERLGVEYGTKYTAKFTDGTAFSWLR